MADRITALFNSTFYQNDKIFASFELRAFADHKSNFTQNIKFVFHRVENIVEKGENAGYQHFLLFPQFFQKALSH